MRAIAVLSIILLGCIASSYTQSELTISEVKIKKRHIAFSLENVGREKIEISVLYGDSSINGFLPHVFYYLADTLIIDLDGNYVQAKGRVKYYVDDAP